MYEKQVHVFDKTGAPVLEIVSWWSPARLDLQSDRNEYKHF